LSVLFVKRKNFVFYRLLEVLYTKYGAYFSSKFSFEELLEKFNLAEKANGLVKVDASLFEPLWN